MLQKDEQGDRRFFFLQHNIANKISVTMASVAKIALKEIRFRVFCNEAHVAE